MSEPTVRAKFRVSSIEDFGYSRQLKFSAVYEGPLGENDENKRFTQATPNGTLTMNVDNPYASRQFHVGEEWYLDFTKASEAPEL